MLLLAYYHIMYQKIASALLLVFASAKAQTNQVNL
jgi:hypothetical protein